MIVLFEWPPMTGTTMSESPKEGNASATNAEDLMTSRVVTPKSLWGLNASSNLRVSAITGTIELTGFVMTRMKAFGQAFAIAFARPSAITALESNKSKARLLIKRSYTFAGHARLTNR